MLAPEGGATARYYASDDAVRFDVKHPDDAPTSTQERAYTSPIWYTP